MDNNLVSIVNNCKKKNEKSQIELIEMFSPLINKYKKKLGYEDAKQDLLENFSIIINKIPSSLNKDGQVVNYISTSIHNTYINLLKKEILQHKNNFDFMDNLHIEANDKENENIMRLDLYENINKLDSLEQSIILYKFYYNYKYYEIANKLSLSRKTIYRKKEDALLKLKKQLENKIY